MKNLIFLSGIIILLMGCGGKSLPVKQVDFIAYYVTTFTEHTQCVALETLAKEIPGISKVKANFLSQRFAVAFYPDQTDKKTITEKLGEVKDITLKIDEFQTGKASACPVHNSPFLKKISGLFY